MGKLIEWLIARAIAHRAVVVGATLVLFAAGIWAFARLTTDAYPDLTPNQVIVMTTAAGLSPIEAEQELSYPMEIAMLGLPRTTECGQSQRPAFPSSR